MRQQVRGFGFSTQPLTSPLREDRGAVKVRSPMPDLDLHHLPAELQAALERVWPGCPEAQRRALLAPHRLGWAPLWPHQMWAWQPASRWWRPGAARKERAWREAFFGAHLRDARGEPYNATGPVYEARLFDPAQPFFDTPWTQASVLLRSPVPDVFSDADFWVITQQLSGGHVPSATSTAVGWSGWRRAKARRRCTSVRARSADWSAPSISR